MQGAAKTVSEVLAKYKAAVFAKDAAAFNALYSADIIAFDIWSWSYDGQTFPTMVVDWFGSLGNDLVIVDFDQVTIFVEDGMAVVHAISRFRAVSDGGTELRSMQNRLTWALKQLAGSWKIFHEHTSGSADSTTMKIMTRPTKIETPS